MPGFDASLLGPDEMTSTTGNVPLARKLLQSYADNQCGGQFSRCPPIMVAAGFLPCSISGDSTSVAFEQAVARMWQQAFPGYPIKVAIPGGGCDLISSIYTDVMPSVLDAGWFADYPDPQDWLSLQFGSAAINNFASVELPIANTIMAQADKELDPNQRFALYNQAEQLLVQSVAWIPVGQSLSFYDVRDTVAGFGLTALGSPSLDQVYGLRMVKR
jgi:peptide/nickel transport system substrate-binding protein/oligopeptide transport system substrate-binding protein